MTHVFAFAFSLGIFSFLPQAKASLRIDSDFNSFFEEASDPDTSESSIAEAIKEIEKAKITKKYSESEDKDSLKVERDRAREKSDILSVIESGMRSDTKFRKLVEENNKAIKESTEIKDRKIEVVSSTSSNMKVIIESKATKNAGGLTEVKYTSSIEPIVARLKGPSAEVIPDVTSAVNTALNKASAVAGANSAQVEDAKKVAEKLKATDVKSSKTETYATKSFNLETQNSEAQKIIDDVSKSHTSKDVAESEAKKAALALDLIASKTTDTKEAEDIKKVADQLRKDAIVTNTSNSFKVNTDGVETTNPKIKAALETLKTKTFETEEEAKKALDEVLQQANSVAGLSTEPKLGEVKSLDVDILNLAKEARKEKDLKNLEFESNKNVSSKEKDKEMEAKLALLKAAQDGRFQKSNENVCDYWVRVVKRVNFTSRMKGMCEESESESNDKNRTQSDRADLEEKKDKEQEDKIHQEYTERLQKMAASTLALCQQKDQEDALRNQNKALVGQVKPIVDSLNAGIEKALSNVVSHGEGITELSKLDVAMAPYNPLDVGLMGDAEPIFDFEACGREAYAIMNESSKTYAELKGVRSKVEQFLGAAGSLLANTPGAIGSVPLPSMIPLGEAQTEIVNMISGLQNKLGDPRFRNLIPYRQKALCLLRAIDDRINDLKSLAPKLRGTVDNGGYGNSRSAPGMRVPGSRSDLPMSNSRTPSPQSGGSTSGSPSSSVLLNR